MASPTLSPLTKIDSLEPATPSKISASRRRRSSALSNPSLTVHSVADLEKDATPLVIPIETQKLNWKINSPSSSVEDKEYLSLPLCQPVVKKMDLIFPHGLHVVARNLRGVTIKDALDAIYKANKKKSSDELEGKEYLRGFEWDPEECYSRFVVHTMSQPTKTNEGKKKKNKKDKDEGM